MGPRIKRLLARSCGLVVQLLRVQSPVVPLAELREAERFRTAAARWHARFVVEAGLPLREAEGAEAGEGAMPVTGTSSGAGDELTATGHLRRKQPLEVCERITTSATYAP